MAALWVEALIGIALLSAGGEVTLRGIVRLLNLLRLPAALIGVALIAYGSCLPELAVSATASLTGSPDIALGTALGSAIASILLILGLTAAISPLMGEGPLAGRDGAAMCGAAALFIALGMDGIVSRLDGVALIVGAIAYTLYRYRADASMTHSAILARFGKSNAWNACAYAVMGLSLLATGADMLIDGASGIAGAGNVSESVIALTLVAIGAGTPELIASLVAAWKRRNDIAITAVISTNVFTLLGIIGVAALINPLPVATRFLKMDVWVMLASFLLLLGLLAYFRGLGRKEGALFIALYVAYVIYVLHANP